MGGDSCWHTDRRKTDTFHPSKHQQQVATSISAVEIVAQNLKMPPFPSNTPVCEQATLAIKFVHDYWKRISLHRNLTESEYLRWEYDIEAIDRAAGAEKCERESR